MTYQQLKETGVTKVSTQKVVYPNYYLLIALVSNSLTFLSIDSEPWERKSLSRVSNTRSATQHEEGNVAYAKQLQANEKQFLQQQKRYLGNEYEKQQREKALMQRLEKDRKMQEHYQMKADEQHLKSVCHFYVTFIIA